jgi:hypothetical protein
LSATALRPRAAPRALRAALALAGGGALCACGGSRDVEPAGAAAYRADPRIAELLAPCTQGLERFYDRDTSDLLPVLIEKLESGRQEPLHRALEELGALGARSTSELRRMIERHAGNAAHSAWVENALDAAGRSEDPALREVILRMLDHPQDSVRLAALRALTARHARPEDFERLLAHVEGLEAPELARRFATALFASDPQRAAELVLSWLRQGSRRELWADVLPLLAGVEEPGIAAACAELQAGLEPADRGWVATCAARAGDQQARAYLVAELAHPDPNRRTRAVRALTLAGLPEELAGTLARDEDVEVRLLAADALGAELGWSAARRAALAPALEDASPLVREHALKRLVERGDSEAIDRALVHLGGPPDLLQAALTALRGAWTRDPELARRGLERLMTRHEREALRPIQERRATLKAIGLVPLADAARFLCAQALAAEGQEIETLRAHEWLMIQAANTMPAGRAELEARLDAERDPARRIDLLWALSAERSAESRAAMLAIAEGAARSPYEVLFAADRLVKLGPSELVAPRLKRVAHAAEESSVRAALSCLLWTWY